MILDGRGVAREAFPDWANEDGPAEYLAAFGYDPPPADRVSDAAPLDAEVNHGLWIARCECRTPGLPAPGGMVWFDTPLIWCPRCRNAATDGAWRRVRLPADRAAIERELLKRPDPATWNCWPGETPADLARENAEHGVADPNQSIPERGW